jgi:signal transduction histidine kinase
VLHNLVDNAISYSTGTIEISVRAGEIRIANTTTLDNADHVFDRFWRNDTARTAGHAGLGLSICKRLVEAIGGSIRAEVIDKQFVVIVVVDRSRSAH